MYVYYIFNYAILEVGKKKNIKISINDNKNKMLNIFNFT